MSLVTYLSEVEYTCGSPLMPPGHMLHNVAFVRMPLNCGDIVEIAYYSTGYGPLDICCFCTEEAYTSVELRKQYKTVLPACNQCIKSGREIVCYRPYGKGV